MVFLLLSIQHTVRLPQREVTTSGRLERKKQLSVILSAAALLPQSQGIWLNAIAGHVLMMHLQSEFLSVEM